MTPRFLRRALVATMLMLLALGATAALGVWQYTVAHRNDVANEVAAAPAAPLAAVSEVGRYLAESDYGRLVEFAGEVDCGSGVRVTLGAANADWQVCPLQLPDGSRVALVVGRAGTADTSGPLAGFGRMQPAQDFEIPPARYPAAPPAAVEFLNTAELGLRWRSDVRDGYLVLTDQAGQPQAAAGLQPLAWSDLNWPPVGIELRNLFYAWQWWIFAAFAVFIWGRYLRDEWRGTALAAPPAAD